MKHVGQPRGRIFVHRDRGNRGLVNEEDVYALARQNGFEVVKLEDMKLAAQAAMFAQAEFVIGLHGAGLANVVFCAAGTTVIEILPLRYSTPAYAIMASQAGVRYLPYLEVNETNRRLAFNGQYSDTEIDLNHWQEFLEHCLPP